MIDKDASVLVSNMKIEGNITEKESLVIDGEITGNIDAETVKTNENSNIKGNISTPLKNRVRPGETVSADKMVRVSLNNDRKGFPDWADISPKNNEFNIEVRSFYYGNVYFRRYVHRARGGVRT